MSYRVDLLHRVDYVTIILPAYYSCNKCFGYVVLARMESFLDMNTNKKIAPAIPP